MKYYVVGIDVGATKSHLAIFDTQGNRIGFAQWGPLNHEVLPGSFQQFEDEMQCFITQAFETYQITMEQVTYATFGIAGVDVKRQHEIISGILKKIGFKDFTLCNDAFLGVMSGLRNGTGICAINGTGSTIAGIGSEGRMFQIGGIGDLSDDRGGGSYIGCCVGKVVYRDLFCKGEPTLLTQMVLDSYGIEDKYDYIEEVTRQEEEGNYLPEKVNQFVFPAVDQGDQVAKQILLDMVDFYSHAIAGMIEEIYPNNKTNIDIVLAGSVFVKGRNPLLLNGIKSGIHQFFPDSEINYVLLSQPPVSGAVIWSLKKVHGNNDYFDKVSGQFLVS